MIFDFQDDLEEMERFGLSENLVDENLVDDPDSDELGGSYDELSDFLPPSNGKM